MPSLSDYRNKVISRLPAPLDFGLFVLRRLRDERCLDAAGSLTFTTLLALVPFLTIALMVVSAFPMFEEISSRFKLFLLSNLVPDSAGKVITVYMRQFAENTGRLTAVGMSSLALTALLTMSTIDQTFNRIWHVRRQRTWLVKTLTYWGVLTLGPLLVGLGLTLTSWLAVGAGNGSMAAFLSGSGIVLALAGFTLLYRVVPNCPVPFKHALFAASFTTLTLGLMKNLFGLYVKQFGTFKLVYGAFASLPVFLLWLYLMWVVILIGAVLTASLSYWHGQAWKRRVHSGQRLYDAVRLLLKLEDARKAGITQSLDSLRRQLGLGQDELHDLLERLSIKGWTQSTRTDGWLLATALERISLQELYHLLVTHPVAPPRSADGLHRLLNERFGLVEDALAISLADLARMSRAGDTSSSVTAP